MAIPAVLFALTLLHAGYWTQLCFRQPSTKKISQRSESWLMYVAVSDNTTNVARILISIVYSYHATVSLFLTQAWFDDGGRMLHQVCPSPQYVDKDLFVWSWKSVGLLALLYAGCYVRFQAYAKLGSNFTYRIATPDALVTDGVYAYVRHPSYSGLFAVLIALYGLCLTQHASISCWLPAVSSSFRRQLDESTIFAYLVPGIGLAFVNWFIMTRRVQEEEIMMEREFGQRWREYRMRTKKFIPYLI